MTIILTIPSKATIVRAAALACIEVEYTYSQAGYGHSHDGVFTCGSAGSATMLLPLYLPSAYPSTHHCSP